MVALVVALAGALAACSSSSSPSHPAAAPTPSAEAGAAAASPPPRTCAQVAAAYKAYQKQEQQVRGDNSLSDKDRDSRLLDLHGTWAQLVVDHPTCFSGPQIVDAQSYLDLLKTPPPTTPPPAQPTRTPCPTPSASGSSSASPSPSVAPTGTASDCGGNPAANL